MKSTETAVAIVITTPKSATLERMAEGKKREFLNARNVIANENVKMNKKTEKKKTSGEYLHFCTNS